MKILQKFALVLTAAVMGVGLLGSPATAGDSSWGCGGCVIAKGAID